MTGPDEIVVTCRDHPGIQVAVFEHSNGSGAPEPDWWYFKNSLVLGGGPITKGTGLREWYDPMSDHRQGSRVLEEVTAGADPIGRLLLRCPHDRCTSMEFGYRKVVAACRLIAAAGNDRVSAHGFRAVIHGM